ncbi:diguanylate cyclase [Aestuariibacter halophilus]|uniref:diguanylate cyclase n=1 Tax=Fluctibacter halophilus TaxID=226011 RepID=A0ABS8GAW7_9ALTE|nr:diguanylate cyclase [Aestuariibacter halophilus]MCC2617321.1 diguanylate cyclase [Aestuariibacter halophilus]
MSETNNTARKQARLPLSRILTGSFLAILALFLLIILLAFSRLFDFRDLLTRISQDSIPAVTLTSQIYSEVNTLTYLSEAMANADTDVARKLSWRQINQQLEQLHVLANAERADPFLRTQLAALTLELSELNSLVERRLDMANRLQERLHSLSETEDELVELLSQETALTNAELRWSLSLMTLLEDIQRLEDFKRLLPLRQLSEQISVQAQQMREQQAILSPRWRELTMNFLLTAEQEMNSDTGVIGLRIEQLKLNGRTTGRGNFVRNLILDYVGLAEFQSEQTNRSIVQQSAYAQTQVKEQIQRVGIIAIVAIVLMLGLLYYLQVQVVDRLRTLNRRVTVRMDGRGRETQLSGNDEITDIDATFEQFARTIESQNRILEELSLSDSLTGLANRRAFNNQFAHTLELARRHNWAVTILAMDVDYFKAYNDHFGHLQGDECLKKLATIMRAHLQRGSDFVARIGGEEFVAILPDTDADGGYRRAEEVRASVEQAHIPHPKSTINDAVTMSIGVITYRFTGLDTVTPAELIKQADDALYLAKQEGRNRVVKC